MISAGCTFSGCFRREAVSVKRRSGMITRLCACGNGSLLPRSRYLLVLDVPGSVSGAQGRGLYNTQGMKALCQRVAAHAS